MERVHLEWIFSNVGYMMDREVYLREEGNEEVGRQVRIMWKINDLQFLN